MSMRDCWKKEKYQRRRNHLSSPCQESWPSPIACGPSPSRQNCLAPTPQPWPPEGWPSPASPEKISQEQQSFTTAAPGQKKTGDLLQLAKDTRPTQRLV